MKNDIYKHTWRPAVYAPSGVAPGLVTVTEETNGYAVWKIDGTSDPEMLAWRADRDAAIMIGVDCGRELANGIGV